MEPVQLPSDSEKRRPLDPFRRAVVRGLGVLLPPLLTIVIFLWIGNTVAIYLLEPSEGLARYALINYFEGKILPQDAIPANQLVDGRGEYEGVLYQQTADGRFVRAEHYDELEEDLPGRLMPESANGFYRAYIDNQILVRRYVVPLFLCVFVLVLYLLGRFLAAGAGRFFWMQFERLIHRLPLVRNVYSSVKQVTDFLFSESEIEYTRVVAVEYPRKGIWSLGMVTGESMLDIGAAANEPVLSVLIPTSPLPFTGFTVTVKRSEAVDLDITIDQAFQFLVSGGVVVPPQQMRRTKESRPSPPRLGTDKS